jgi:hypothetical protein
VYPHLTSYYDNRYWNKLKIYINESDGASRAPQTFQIYSGVTCEIYRTSGDDRVGSAYNSDYGWHGIGDAKVIWRKMH